MKVDDDNAKRSKDLEREDATPQEDHCGPHRIANLTIRSSQSSPSHGQVNWGIFADRQWGTSVIRSIPDGSAPCLGPVVTYHISSSGQLESAIDEGQGMKSLIETVFHSRL